MVPSLAGGLFHFIPLFIGLLFILIVVTFILNLLKGLKSWFLNQNRPIKTVMAKVIAKRTEVKNLRSADTQDPFNSDASTFYFATFEDELGNRIELRISGKDYGLMADDDNGELTYQGTRFKGFKRRLRSYSS